MSDSRLQAFAERIERVLEEARDAGYDAEDVRKAIAERRAASVTPLKALKLAVEITGGQLALAKALGRPHQSYVSEMLRRLKARPKTKIPAENCPVIEAITKGVVTRQMLRPDFPWSAA
jgi:DNA-binding transcriptional regulator YdaS (Cro superfamily)